MRLTPLVGLLAAGLVTFAPAVSASGWLLNVETPLIGVKWGTNPFGGQGDAVDVGVFNHQCSDEEDVVDVGVANSEGDQSCPSVYGQPCNQEQGHPSILNDLLDAVISPQPPANNGQGECSDDADTVDVGVLNAEGGYQAWGQSQCGTPVAPPSSNHGHPSGDNHDAVDAGVLNTECEDSLDGGDAGVINCEWTDDSDGLDVGALNTEEVSDKDDTFDASLLNWEMNDLPDHNGINVKPLGFSFGCIAFPGGSLFGTGSPPIVIVLP